MYENNTLQQSVIPIHQLDGCINTVSGKKFNLLEPVSAMVDIKDIAHGLAYKAHFGGQMQHYFSIAQHCNMVVTEMQKYAYSDSLLLLALLHDAAEAYIGDMIKPLKIHLPFFCEVEDRIMQAVCEKYNLDFSSMELIKPFDIRVQEIEFNQFYRGLNSFECMSPEKSLALFLGRFENLMRKIK